MGRRTQADRDAVTVEIGYALLSGAVAGALTFGALAGPKLMFTMPYGIERGLLVAGASLGTVVLVVRVVTVLWRFGRDRGQPSQPGRTRPDS